MSSSSSLLEQALLQKCFGRQEHDDDDPNCPSMRTPLSIVASFLPPSQWLKSLFLLSSKIYEPFRCGRIEESLLQDQSTRKDQHLPSSSLRKEQIWYEQCQFSFPDVLLNEECSKDYSQKKEFKKLFIQQCQVLKRYKSGLYHHTCLEGHLASVSALCCTVLEKSLSIHFPTLFSGDLKTGIAQWDLRSTLQMKTSDYHCNDEGKIIKLLSYRFVQEVEQEENPSSTTSILTVLPYSDDGITAGNAKSSEPFTKTLCLSCTSGNEQDGSHSSLVVFDGMDGSVKYSITKGLNESKKGQSKVLDFNHIGMDYILNSVSNCLNVWKLNKEYKRYELLHQLDDPHQYDVTSIKVIPGQVPLVATSGLDSHICVWNVESGKLMTKIGLPHTSPIKSMFEIFTLNQMIIILSVSMDGSMTLSYCNAKEVSQWKESTILTKHSSGSSVLCSSIISTGIPGQILFSISFQNRTVELYALKLLPSETDSLHFQLSSQPFILSNPSVVNNMILTRNKLICSSRDCMVRMFSLSCSPNFDRVLNCDLVSELDCVSSQCFSMALTPDQSILLLGLSDAAIYYLKFSPRYEWDYPRFELGKDDLVYDNNIHAYLKPPYEEFSIDHVKRPEEDLKRIKCEKFLNHIYKGREKTYLIHHLLSEQECQHLIDMTEKLSYEDCYGYHKDYRSNKRVIVEDKITAQILSERAKPLLPQEYVDDNGQVWDLKFANSRWRFCRYTPGQHFLAPHQDGFYEVDKNTRSFFTFMMYLNGGYEEGRTTFIEAKNKQGPPQPPFIEVGQVEPQAGLCIVFPHHLLHYGSVLKSGVKYLMRSELIYERRRRIQSNQQ